ncbi:putative leucine-rich repeat domain, L domain-containing protein [Medicago truncatula]|uniref:Putative leucine-rich repeat domain, L domain-containing protein n=1 Tax=Medicago truncatula TaxID=3880 RepID=A0A396GSQ7_MEDTR|nr:putative leucine-rich repeat domain, L domain-containing protein [Medicago truncatula]
MNLTNLAYLNLHSNFLHGKLELDTFLNLKKLVFLDLSFNKLSLLSGNNSSHLTNSGLQILQLAECNLVEIPTFIRDLAEMEFLTLSNNNITSLPEWLWKKARLKSLDVSHSSLTGEISPSICNLKSLVMLDFTFNNLGGNIPSCLGNFSQPLESLDLKGNNEFHGDVRCSGNMTCTFSKLHIIDLSHNQFSGSFPTEMIQSWKAMNTFNASQLQYESYSTSNNEGQYFTSTEKFYSLTMSNKGVAMVYNNLQKIYNLIAIDISSNKISGEIPQGIGELKGLVLLNFSNNLLIGSIQSSLGKLSNLEALDLSVNSLSGKIPQQLAQITFLQFLNLSFNNLTGPIPQNNQFSTFKGDSFEGNQGLCGDQLLKKCIDHGGPSTSDDDDDDEDSGSLFEFDWKIVLIGYGGGLVAGMAVGSTFFLQVLSWLKKKDLMS